MGIPYRRVIARERGEIWYAKLIHRGMPTMPAGQRGTFVRRQCALLVIVMSSREDGVSIAIETFVLNALLVNARSLHMHPKSFC